MDRIKRTGVSNLAWHVVCMAVMMALSLGFTACGDDEDEPEPGPDKVWDFAPLDIDIMIVDETGENLLNPMAAGNWMDAPFKMVYKGEDYDTNWTDFISPGHRNEPWSKGRACLATFWGLRCVEYTYWNGKHWTWYENEYLLAFGEFMSDRNHDLKMELYAPGKDAPYKINVEHRFAWVGVDECEMHTRIWVDAKEVDGFPIKIVLPRRDDAPAE